MSIFDSIINDVSSLGDSLGGLSFSDIAGAGLKAASSKKGDDAATVAETNMLTLESMDRKSKSGIQTFGQPYGVTGFKASKTEPVGSVDPEVINQAWLRRLDRYRQIAGETAFPGAKGK